MVGARGALPKKGHLVDLKFGQRARSGGETDGALLGEGRQPGVGGGAKVQQGFAEARDHRELCVKGGALWVL